MLFGGNAAGREATFNTPDVVNNHFRTYDWNFDPAKLARDAGRGHTFAKPPRRMSPKPQWDWVVPHCDEKDGWIDQIRKIMVSLPRQTKWLIHGYERCGIAEVKRPMKEMLREALNHHDRIPHPTNSPAISSWLRHIVMNYKKLPERVFFAPAVVSHSSSVFTSNVVLQAIQNSPDFGIWGSQVVEMPHKLHEAFCSKIWPFAAKARKRSCPDRVVAMADAVVMVTKRRIQTIDSASWKMLADLVDGPSKAENEQLLFFGWHIILGQPAVLTHRAVSRH